MASFFGGSRVYRPSDIEAVRALTLTRGRRSFADSALVSAVGGPERPPAKNRDPPVVPAPRAPRQVTSRRTEQVQDEVDNTQTILGRTTEALNQRAEHLGYLQEKLGEVSSRWNFGRVRSLMLDWG